MMKTVKSIMFVLMFALIAGVAAPAYAETPQQFKGEDIVMRPVQKLGRGIAGITYGTLKGVCFTLVRIGVGVLDIITFPFPLPNCPDNPDGYGPGYGPIMRPAWVIDVNHDWQNFVFSRQSVVTPLN